MSLPQILVPAGTPIFLENGHAQTVRSVYRDVAMGTGVARRRRKTTIAPRTVAVSWFVNSGHVEAVKAWYDNTLKSGSLPFSARVARIGGRGLMWWSATWVGALTYAPSNATQWRVTGELLLAGEGSVDGPVFTSAAAEFSAALIATAAVIQTAIASAEFIAALTTISPSRAEFSAALETVDNGDTPARATSTGEIRITADGDTRITR